MTTNEIKKAFRKVFNHVEMAEQLQACYITLDKYESGVVCTHCAFCDVDGMNCERCAWSAVVPDFDKGCVPCEAWLDDEAVNLGILDAAPAAYGILGFDIINDPNDSDFSPVLLEVRVKFLKQWIDALQQLIEEY